MGRVMQLASFSLAEVTYATGDISYLIQEQAKSASYKVKARQENVSGVVLPAFDVDRVSGSGASIVSAGNHLIFNAQYPRFQLDGSWTRWAAGPSSEGGLRKGHRDAGRASVVTNGVHYPGRGYPSHKSPCQRHRACCHTSLGEHDQVHYERAR